MRRLAAALALAALATPAAPCAVELVLALDVSRSVDADEFDLQVGGLAEAFRDPAVAATVAGLPGGIMVSVTQWSGPLSQRVSLDWRPLESVADAEAFAAAVAGIERAYFASYTAIGEALVHAGAVGEANPRPCGRRVIDISGDGVSNRGRPPKPFAEALAAEGVTINALVVRWGRRRDRVPYFRDNVVRGPGAFVEVADGFEDYARAMRRKLLRELSLDLVAR